MGEKARLFVNGRTIEVPSDPERPLLTVLRDELGLTGAKYACGEGQCGACLVLLDGRPLPACVTPLAAAAGGELLTVEGLERDGELHPLQQAFLDCAAFQCGYCTPGMLMAALALLHRQPDPGERDIVQALQPNLCRCGAYPRIIQAVREAAVRMRAAEAVRPAIVGT